MSGFNEAQYKELISRLRIANERMTSDVDAAIRRIQQKASDVPLVGDAVKRALEEGKRLFNELQHKNEEIIEWSGMPLQLFLLEHSWDQVTNQLNSARNQLYRLGPHFTEWNGIAGGAYKGAVAEQPKAMEKIKSITEQMATACEGAAIAGFTFILAALNALEGFLTGLVTVETGAGFVAGMLDCLASLVAAYASLALGMEPQIRTLNQIYDDNHGYFTPGWPRSARF